MTLEAGSLQMKKTAPTARRVFLSYARSDRARVEKIYERLLTEGFKPFMDVESIGLGSDWEDEIKWNIQNCHFFLACLSDSIVNDNDSYFYNELKIAVRDKSFIIPVRLEDCDLPWVIRRRQAVDVFKRGGLDRLIKKLHEKTEEQLREEARANKNKQKEKSREKKPDEEDEPTAAQVGGGSRVAVTDAEKKKMSSSNESLRASFQGSIDSLHDGETLELPPREFPGPVVIKRPVVIEGHGATVWALKGPVVSVESEGVVLRDLRVEVTGEETANTNEEDCAILVSPGKGILLERVQVRGSVIGLEEEEGDWGYPSSLHLGRLAHGGEHDFTLRLFVPVACRLKSHISGLEVSPHTLKAGANEVRLHVERLSQDTLLSGLVTLSTAFLTRHFTLTAKIVTPDAGHAAPVTGTNQVIWEPSDWAARASGPPPQPKPPEPIPVQPPPAQAPSPSEVAPPPVYPEPPPQPAPQPQQQQTPPPQPPAPAPQPAAQTPDPAAQPSPPAVQTPAPVPAPVPPQTQPVPPVTPPPTLQPPTSGASRYRTQKTSLNRTVFGSPGEPEKTVEEPEAAVGGTTPGAEQGGPALPALFMEQGGGAQPSEPTPPETPAETKPVSLPERTSSPRVRSITLGSVFGEQTPGEKDEQKSEAAEPQKPAPAEAPAEREPKKKKVQPANLPSLFTGGAQNDKEE